MTPILPLLAAIALAFCCFLPVLDDGNGQTLVSDAREGVPSRRVGGGTR
jgi:hypothetical protein